VEGAPMIWADMDPTGTRPSERPDDDAYPWEDEDEHCPDCKRVNCACVDRDDALDAIERAMLDAATRADEWLDEDPTDYDGPDWPF